MPQEYRPLAVFFGAQNASGEIVFNTASGEVVVGSYIPELISLLSMCNGFRTIEEIRLSLRSIDDDVFVALVEVSKANNLIVDSRELYKLGHGASVNPQIYTTDLSARDVVRLAGSMHAHNFKGDRHALSSFLIDSKLEELIAARKTTRELVNVPILASVFAGMFRSISGIAGSRSTPSAGGLYPLDLYAVVNTGQCVPQGIYYYDPRCGDLVTLSKDQVEARCFEALSFEEGIEYSVVFFFAANLKRVCTKYSNRAYRYALIEVGHAAQNAALYCAEQLLGILEYGGFQDHLTSKMLRLDSSHVPILALIVGGLLISDDISLSAQFTRLKKNVFSQKGVDSLLIGLSKSGNLLRWSAQASYHTPVFGDNPQLAFGSTETMAESGIKALAEGCERYASGIFRVDTRGSASNLYEPWFDPTELDIPKFDREAEIEWVKGRRYLTGEQVLVPVDLVFYPFPRKELHRNPFYESNSSGVAAHLDYLRAEKNALLELVERDALMVAWLARQEVTSLPIESVPQDLQGRIKRWEKDKRVVRFVNLQLDGPPIILALIFSLQKYPALSTGCCSALTFAEACHKAFQEAESGLLHALSTPRVSQIMNSVDVVEVSAHQEFYYFPVSGRLRELEWILNAPESTPSKFHESYSYAEVIRKYDPVFVDLTPVADFPLKVIRALSEKLVPINFGFGNEHARHQRFEMLGWSTQVVKPAFPHFFA
ncbi:MAG: hypothetical protein NVS3B9_4460 [Candidatus Doudnabacteria bacterium]